MTNSQTITSSPHSPTVRLFTYILGTQQTVNVGHGKFHRLQEKRLASRIETRAAVVQDEVGVDWESMHDGPRFAAEDLQRGAAIFIHLYKQPDHLLFVTCCHLKSCAINLQREASVETNTVCQKQ